MHSIRILHTKGKRNNKNNSITKGSSTKINKKTRGKPRKNKGRKVEKNTGKETTFGITFHEFAAEHGSDFWHIKRKQKQRNTQSLKPRAQKNSTTHKKIEINTAQSQSNK